jgi:hypothetical protein
MLLTAKSENLNIVLDAIYYTLSISNFLLPSVCAINSVYLRLRYVVGGKKGRYFRLRKAFVSILT